MSLLFKDVYFLITLIVCLVLICFKFQDFYLPYFSDELWVYGPSVRKMGDAIPSMLPSSLAIEDHWAHPMFFFFLGGIWCAIFGSTVLSTHVFAATLSVLLLIVVYLFGKNLFNRKVGFYTMLLFASQSIFLGQFSLVLPEVLLTLFTLLTIYFHLKEKMIFYLISGMCLVLTKESGVFVLFSIFIWELIKDFWYDRKGLSLLSLFKKYFIICFPLVALVIHLILIKLTYGWFIMPIRVEFFEFSWDIYRERIMASTHYVFVDQGRRFMIIVLFLVAIFSKKEYPLWIRGLLFLLAFSMLKIFFKYWKLPEIISMIVVPLFYVGILKIIFFDIYKSDKKEGGVISMFVIFITLFLLFSSGQFDSLRYLLCLIPLFIITVIYFVDQIPYFRKVVIPFFTLIFIAASFYYISINENFGDDTCNYSNDCKIRFETVKFVEQTYSDNQSIKTSFLFSHALTRPLTGYLNTKRLFINVNAVSSNIDDESIYVFGNMEPSENYTLLKNDDRFELVFRAEVENLWTEVYSKRK